MLTPNTLKTWTWLHKWSSLVCTVFMLLLCLTGLPLIFHHEIGHLLGTEVEAPAMPADTPRASLDRILAVARNAERDLGGDSADSAPSAASASTPAESAGDEGREAAESADTAPTAPEAVALGDDESEVQA